VAQTRWGRENDEVGSRRKGIDDWRSPTPCFLSEVIFPYIIYDVRDNGSSAEITRAWKCFLRKSNVGISLIGILTECTSFISACFSRNVCKDSEIIAMFCMYHWWGCWEYFKLGIFLLPYSLESFVFLPAIEIFLD
jgi:hypothetical protein